MEPCADLFLLFTFTHTGAHTMHCATVTHNSRYHIFFYTSSIYKYKYIIFEHTSLLLLFRWQTNSRTGLGHLRIQFTSVGHFTCRCTLKIGFLY
jgi:hypothetical protein